jgi:CheY-like chemotaxis protein
MYVKYMQVKDAKLKIVEDRKLNILLVEDDEVDIMNVQRAFKKNNILNPLFFASNGLEALEMLRGRDGRPSVIPSYRRLILLDLNMPKMGGIEFLQQLRTDPSLQRIPVVILTTSDQDCDRMDAYKLNVAGYILKPVTFANFVEMMDALNRYWAFSEIL